MPLVSGALTDDGAVIGVLIGVSANRRKALTRVGLPVPDPVPVRVQIDTGSFVTVLMPSVYRSLGITSFGTILIRTPSTRRGTPCEAEQFDVSVSLVSGTTLAEFGSVYAIASEDFQEAEPIQGLIGRDVLARCVFNYSGPHRSFELGW